MTKTELIAALQQGPGGAERDAAVLLAHGLPVDGNTLKPTQVEADAIKVVVPKGWEWTVRYSASGAWAELYHAATRRTKCGKAPTTARALCVASLTPAD
jgi:hypothetical protein